MDFFNCRYYSITRKLLLLIGQWPFQNWTERIVKHIFILFITLSLVTVQVAKLMSPDVTVNVATDIIITQIATMICAIKYFTFSIQTKKIRHLLKTIEADWKSLKNDDDHKIVQESAEEGRRYNLVITFYIYSSTSLVVTAFTLQPLLNVVAPMNETRENILLYPAEYFIDHQKYYSPITLHMSITLLTAATVLIATDSLYFACIYHACGIFKLVRFVDVLVSTFNVSLFLVIMLAFCNISITLYWAAMSSRNVSQMMIALLFGGVQMFHALMTMYPCQKVLNESSTIHFKAYSGLWYMAPIELKTLILPIIQRGAKPAVICVVKMIVVSMEFYAKAIQLSVSYFTVLLSFV